MPKIKVNDISMYYETYGQGEPLVLISGFSADHLSWGFILDYLITDYQVVIFDNRGTGQTDVPKGPYSIEQMAQDIMDLCSYLGIKKAHFIGNSMGGHLVQMLAYRHASRVKSAVISNSAMARPTCFHTYLEAYLELLKANAPRTALIQATFSWLFSPSFLSQPDQLEGFIQLSLNNPFPFTITGFEGQYAALTAFDSRAWAHKINVPTLIIGSAQDLIFSPEATKALQEQISQADYYCFKNCGHLPHLEYPQELATTIKKFIASQ